MLYCTGILWNNFCSKEHINEVTHRCPNQQEGNVSNHVVCVMCVRKCLYVYVSVYVFMSCMCVCTRACVCVRMSACVCV